MVEGPTKLPQEEKDKIIQEVAVKYLNNVTGADDFDIKDLSGFSNATYILSSKNPDSANEKYSKLALRFFENTTADVALENKVFRIMGDQGFGPKEVICTPTYRVEEGIKGRALHMLELRNPHILKHIASSMCDVNYNDELKKAALETKGGPHLLFQDFMGEQGWFTFAFGTREAAEWALPEEETAKSLLEFMDSKLKSEEFKKEFKALLVKPRCEADKVFSHNDFQENNAMLRFCDPWKPIFIDFEYSQMNTRGADLASIVLESMIDYAYDGEIPFKVYLEHQMSK